jgi:hypothetical protein
MDKLLKLQPKTGKRWVSPELKKVDVEKVTLQSLGQTDDSNGSS